MTRLALAYAVTGLAVLPAAVLAQNPPAPAQNSARRTFEKFTVEGQPVDRRAPELDTDHPVFPGQTHAPYHKTVDVEVTTIASGLDVPWAVELLPSGRFLVTEKAGRLRILNKDGSTLHTITANMPPVYYRGQAGLLDVALDKDFARNHRIFYVYLRDIDAENCAHAVDSATLDENGGTISNVATIFEAAPFTKRSVSQSGSRIAIDPKDGNLFVAVGDRSTGDPLPLQAQHLDTYLGKVIHITPEGKPAPGNPSLGLPGTWSMGHRTPQGLTFAPDGRLWEVEHGPRGGDELNLIEPGRNYGWPLITYGMDYSGAYVSPYTAKPGLEQPVVQWTPSIAPSGTAIYRGDKFPAWNGDIFVGALAFKHLRRVHMDEQGNAVSQEQLLTELGHRIRDVRASPDGYLYVTTDDADGKVLRLEPAN